MSQEIRKKLIEHASLFYSRGLMLGTAGNMSAREGSGDFWITASGCDKGLLTPSNFVRLNLEGAVQEKFYDSAKPSAEASIHMAVYNAYPEARACYHVHSVESNVVSTWAENGVLKLPAIEMLKGFSYFGKNPSILVFKNHDAVPDIAKDMSATFKKSKPEIPALLIEGHGVTVWAETQEKARNYIELIEFIFRYMVLEKLARN